MITLARFGFLPVLLLAAWWPVRIAAQRPILDVYSEPAGNSGMIVARQQWLAQTVRFNTAGTLSAVELPLIRGADLPVNHLLLEVRPLNHNGTPSILVQTAKVIPAAQVGGFGGFLVVDLTEANVAVQAGSRLAFSLRTEAVLVGPQSDPFAWLAQAPGAYAEGAGFIANGSFGNESGWTEVGYDFGFRAYVTPIAIPEPAPVALAVVAVTILAGCRGRGQTRVGGKHGG